MLALRKEVQRLVHAQRAPLYPAIPASLIVDELHAWDFSKITLDAAFGAGNVTTWASRRGVYSPTQGTGAARPNYAADSTYFRGLPCVQSTNAARSLSSAAGSTIFANASKPYVLTIGRMRALPPSGTCGITQFADAGVSINGPGLYQTTTQLQNFFPASTLSVGYTSLVPAFIECFLTAAGVNTLVVNGVSLGTNGTGLTDTAACTRMSIGANIGGANKTDFSFVYQLTAPSVLDANVRQYLRRWARLLFGHLFV